METTLRNHRIQSARMLIAAGMLDTPWRVEVAVNRAIAAAGRKRPPRAREASAPATAGKLRREDAEQLLNKNLCGSASLREEQTTPFMMDARGGEGRPETVSG